MGKRRIKTLVAAGFLSGLAAIYLADAGAQAQHAPKAERREAVLASVVRYKSWDLVSKPPAPPSTVGLTGTLTISDSTVYG